MPYQAAETFYFHLHGSEANLMAEARRQKIIDAMRQRPFLLNRAPSLHRYNLLAFDPDPNKPFWDEAVIAIHPLVCAGFGADFDGDTMAFHLPLSDSTIAEARQRLSARRHLFSTANGSLLLHLAQDIVAGVYLMTSNENGRIWLSKLLDDKTIAERSSPLDKDALRKVVERYLRRAVAKGEEEFQTALEDMDAIMRRVFQEATEHGLSFSIADLHELTLSQEKRQEFARKARSDTDTLREECGKEIWEKLKTKLIDHPIAVLALSGARGDKEQLARLCGAVTAKATRGSLSCYVEGLPLEEYFEAAKEAREDMMPKKLGTPEGGDLTRKLIYGLYPLRIVDEKCSDIEGLPLFLDDEFFDKFLPHFIGKHVVENVDNVITAGKVIDEEIAKKLLALPKEERPEILRIFSPITCQTTGGVCARCYGWDLSTRQLPEIGLPVGILAAQSIGERATQDFMKVFHGIKAGVLKKIKDAKSLMEWGKIPKELTKDAVKNPATLLAWLVKAYEQKVNMRHFEIVLRQMRTDEGWRGLVDVAKKRNEKGHPEHSPLAAAAFQSPVNMLIEVAMEKYKDKLKIEPAPLFVGRATRSEVSQSAKTHAKTKQR